MTNVLDLILNNFDKKAFPNFRGLKGSFNFFISGSVILLIFPNLYTTYIYVPTTTFTLTNNVKDLQSSYAAFKYYFHGKKTT